MLNDNFELEVKDFSTSSNETHYRGSFVEGIFRKTIFTTFSNFP